jgi:hypothetical protein
VPDEQMFEVPGRRLHEMADALELARHTINELREEAKLHEDFVVACTELIPEGYDNDESAESIILRYLKDMDTFAGIIARLTSAYR